MKGIIISLAALSVTTAYAQKIEGPSVISKTSFAIVVDDSTYLQAAEEINAYKSAIEGSGLGTYIVHHHWKKPEEIRKVLKDLYARPQRLEGAVLIGDIPVPMIRDAQYLTSTFKMNQKINWQRSSVPSDRFYDDFHLEFDFIKQDSLQKNYFYYSINPDAAQQIHLSIYSARIKPPVVPGKDKYTLIREYLRKVVAGKKEQNGLDNMFVSTAHGYNSESVNAFAGEQLALRNQFPAMFLPGNTIRFFHFTNDRALKFHLLKALQLPETDLAVMHGHGDSDIQLINGYPYVSSPTESKDNILRYLRSKIRAAQESGKDIAAAKANYEKYLDVPVSWMDNALDPAVMKDDSIFNHNLDIHIEDIIAARPNTRVVLLDNCLTGSFHLDKYLAGYYPFSEGGNIVSVANSVGVLQDLWATELLGLLQHGVRVGNWFRHMAYLETHIMGDPTFCFNSSSRLDLNAAITGRHDAAFWRSLLKTPDADVQALALVQLADKMDKAAYSTLLKDTYFSSGYESTRLEAFLQLEKLNSSDFITVLKAATTDPYEFIRRRSLYAAAEIGSDELAPAIANMIAYDMHSERIAFKAQTAMTFINEGPMLKALKEQNVDKKFIAAVTRNGQKMKALADTILDASKPDKERIAEITMMRAYRYHQTVPALITVAKDAGSSEPVRLAALEALSWFPRSWRRDDIIALCREAVNGNGYTAALKAQARKNLNIFQ